MGQSREQMMQKVKAHRAQYEKCRDHAYEHPEYQQYFQMTRELVDFIVHEHTQGNLDGDDLYHCPSDLEQLFGMYKHGTPDFDLEISLQNIKKDIKTYIESDS